MTYQQELVYVVREYAARVLWRGGTRAQIDDRLSRLATLIARLAGRRWDTRHRLSFSYDEQMRVISVALFTDGYLTRSAQVDAATVQALL